MTIPIVKVAPLPFERIVFEELAKPFSEHGFQLEEPFHLFKNRHVLFMRLRRGLSECIEFHRALYDAELLHKLNNEEDEVEAEWFNFGDEKHWVSRHKISVHFIVDGATNWLQTNGKAGTGEDYWWHFTDEQDLRRLVRELLPMILAAGQQTFDDTLEHNQSEEGKQWQALERRQNEEISRAVRQLGDNYSEEQYKAAVLGVLEQGMELLEKG